MRRGLYAITSEALCASEPRLLEGVAAALRGGAVLLQYRDKWNPPMVRHRFAEALLKLCREHAVPLIINDDVALAAQIGADGVHLGRSDAPWLEARQQLGPKALVGVTCGADLERAVQAAAQGAAYVAFGRIYPSRTKPQAPPAPADILAQARARLPAACGICAIGGITPENAATLFSQGADLVAAVEGLFGADDIEAAARAYAACRV